VRRPLRVLPVLGVLLATAATLPAAEGDPAEGLRTAWIEHRLRGRLDAAEAAYRAVVDDPASDADLRARGRLGLALGALDERIQLPGPGLNAIKMLPPATATQGDLDYFLASFGGGTGRYYGSDGLRSPLDRYRAPGSPEFEGSNRSQT